MNADSTRPPSRRTAAMQASARGGFVLLEAVIALLIVGVFAVAALAALGGRLRAATVVERTLVVRALAEDRFAAIELLPGLPQPLPDSLVRGVFAPPFEAHRWTASVRPVRGEQNLYDVTVTVRGESSDFTLQGRLFRPPATVGVRPR